MCDFSETWKNIKDRRFILDGNVIEIVKGYTSFGLYFSNSSSLKIAAEENLARKTT